MELVIEFQGKEFLLLGDLETGGPIATREQYENGLCSYAHLYKNGVIKRLGQPIGNRTDIAVTGDTRIVLGKDRLSQLNRLDGLLGDTWPW